jgi:hypothetical protein
MSWLRILWLLLFSAFPLAAEQVVFSKIMYHPPENRPEYIEVYNNTATPFDIAKWRLSGGAHFDFPEFSTDDPALTFLKPFERIVLCGESPEKVRAAYQIPATVRVFGPWSGRLDNAGERITLKDKNGVTVCTVHYGTRGHWPLSPAGAGHALVLKNPNRSVDDWRNWTASRIPGGAPGRALPLEAETPASNPEEDLSQGMILVNVGSTYKYNDSGTDPGPQWTTMGFDDKPWRSGKGLLGYEDAVLPAPGIRTPLKKGVITCFFRKKFVFQGDPKSARVSIDQIVDDGAVYYLNGREIGRSRMPAGVIRPNTLASESVGDATDEIGVLTIDGSYLKQGTNILAAEVHQAAANSSDFVFGMRLRIRPLVAPSSPVAINEIAIGRNGFVEFLNTNAEAVNLKGYYLSDQSGDYNKYKLADDLTIPAGGLGAVAWPENVLTNLSSLYLTSTDGVTVLQGLRLPTIPEGLSLARKSAGLWALLAEPSRAKPNTVAVDTLHLNEVHFLGQSRVNWIEVFNHSESPVTGAGLFLASKPDFSDKIPIAPLIPGRGFASQACRFFVKKSGLELFLVNASGTVLDSRFFDVPAGGGSYQAFPEGSQEWYLGSADTRDAANQPLRNRNVIISEIMYHPPSVLSNAVQFIELFNRGQAPVDLSGWRFTDGVQFQFPPGIKISPGGYLVITGDTNRFRASYGDVAALGNFQGRLSHKGEMVRLVDSMGNLVNQVDYRTGGDWPALADGLGSSLELLNPAMDNELPSAWGASDEMRKGRTREYTLTGKYEELHTKGAPTDYKELHFHLVGDGEIALENVVFRKLGTERNFIRNGDKLSDDGLSAKGWLCQGNHAESFLTNGQLHIVSSGRGDNRANRVEIDVTDMRKGDECELKFNARWVSGKPRLIAQTWDHSIAGSFLVDVPQNLGTPGAPNSCAVRAPAPQVDGLVHSPAVPRSKDIIRISARVSAGTPLESVQLWHRLDNERGTNAWVSAVMHDDGQNGDLVANDGVYTAELAKTYRNAQVVQFYVTATARNGLAASQPRLGSENPAMLVIDDRNVPRDLRTVRFIVSQHDLSAIADGNTAKYGFKYPRHSNRYVNCTFISNEQDIFYNGENRNSGSPWTRGGGLDRPKFKVPGDRLFRGHDHLYFDNDPAGGNFHNRVTRYWLYLMGHPVNENEIVRVVVNNYGIDLREDTEPVGNNMVARNFRNGNQGQLYRIDDEWWFMDNWERDSRDADWGYKGSDNPGRYRTEWMKRSNETEDNYQDLIAFFKLVSGDKYAQEQIERVLDADAVLKYAVVRGYIADWDTFTMSRGKNSFFYERPDGKFQFLHWDSDLAFGDPNAGFYGGRIAPWLDKPYNKRHFHYYLAEFQEKVGNNLSRFQSWLQAEEDASKSYSPNPNFYLGFCSNRTAAVTRELGKTLSTKLEFKPLAKGNTVTNETITLSGTAPVSFYSVQFEPNPGTNFVWRDELTWRVSKLPIHVGTNRFTIKGLDISGKVTAQATTEIVRAAPTKAE